jgi:hypothetical protein
MANFKSGDVCIYDGPILHPRAVGYINAGDMVTLIERDVRPGWWILDKHDSCGGHLVADEIYLRKLPPKEQPADQDFQEWFKKTVVKEATAPKEVRTI